jgi:peptidoglycan/xylan/chitin deacetylase (PgdA/CDA1 family)
MYHRVASRRDPLGLCVTPEHFADQLDALGRRFDLVGLRDARARSRDARVVITFDDGYADNAEVAGPALVTRGAPATFFVTSRVLHDSRAFWWDRLERIVLDAPADRTWLEIDIDGRALRADLRGPIARARTLDATRRRVEGLVPETRDMTIDEISSRLGREPADDVTDRFITPDLLRVLAADGFEIGAHSATHPRLDLVAPDRARREVMDSRTALEAVVGQVVTSFAYPHGRRNRWAERAVRDAGFARCCVVERGLVSPRTHRLRFPRLGVPDVPGTELAKLIAAAFVG